MTVLQTESHLDLDRAIDLSVVVPLYNEEDNIEPAVEEILGVLDSIDLTSELILVDDGSRDATGAKAFAWQTRDARVRVVQFRRNFGQTAAISAGFDHASGRTVVLIDGDQQNDPADIPRMLEQMNNGYNVVSGWRAQRKDKLIMRKLPSKVANALISRITGTRLHDYGCTLKAYDTEVVQHLRLYGELHRFIPALASMAGANVIEIPVNHRARTRGSSKYGISRTFRVLLDLITVKFLLSYMGRPMQLFGRAALSSFAVTLVTAAMVLLQRWFGFTALKGETWVQLSALSFTLGALFLCMGLLGEMLMRVYHEGVEKRPYVVRRASGFAETTSANRNSVVVDLVPSVIQRTT